MVGHGSAAGEPELAARRFGPELQALIDWHLANQPGTADAVHAQYTQSADDAHTLAVSTRDRLGNWRDGLVTVPWGDLAVVLDAVHGALTGAAHEALHRVADAAGAPRMCLARGDQ